MRTTVLLQFVSFYDSDSSLEETSLQCHRITYPGVRKAALNMLQETRYRDWEAFCVRVRLFVVSTENLEKHVTSVHNWATAKPGMLAEQFTVFCSHAYYISFPLTASESPLLSTARLTSASLDLLGNFLHPKKGHLQPERFQKPAPLLCGRTLQI